MERQPIIRSQIIRKAVIAVLMLAGLGVTLAFANVLVDGRTIELLRRPVGELSVVLSGRWKAQEPQPPVNHATLQGSFEEKATQRRLIIATLSSPSPRSPKAALIEAMVAILPKQEIGGTERFYAGPLAGLRYVGFTTDEGRRQLSIAAVMTRDGRRYDLILLTRPVDRRSGVQGERQLHDQICRSLVTDRWHPAEAEALAAVGLDANDPLFTEPQGAVAMLPAGEAPATEALTGANRPLTCFARSGRGVAMMRVLLVPDTAVAETELPPPPALLAARFADVTGENHTREQLQRAEIEGQTAWSLIWTGSKQGLLRTTWYVPVGGGRAALLDTLASPDASQRKVLSWITPMVRAMRPRLAERAAWQAGELHDAIGRGSALGDTMTSRVASTHRAGMHYAVFFLGDKPVALAADLIHPPRRGHLSLHGVGMQRFLDAAAPPALLGWAVSKDGRDFMIERQHRRDGVVEQHEMAVEGGMMTIKTRRGARPPEPDKQVPLHDGFLSPVGQDNWPIDQWSGGGAFRAVVWRSHNLRTPTPCWLHAAVTEDGAAIVRIRPMFDLDADVMMLDRQGKVVRHMVFDRSDNRLGPTKIRIENHTRKSLLDAYPRLGVELDQLERDVNDQS